MEARLNVYSQNISSIMLPWVAVSKRIGNDEDVRMQGFGKIAYATITPLHFQLLELDLLLELLELLLVEVCRAALILSTNSYLRQDICFFHDALVECPLLISFYIKAIRIRYAPWSLNIGDSLYGAYAELTREHGVIFRKEVANNYR